MGRTVGRVQLAREGEEETPRRVCLTHAGRMTGLPATALGSVREASVRAACVFGAVLCPCGSRAGEDAPRPQNHPLRQGWSRKAHVCDFSCKYRFPERIGFASDVTVKVACFLVPKEF